MIIITTEKLFTVYQGSTQIQEDRDIINKKSYLTEKITNYYTLNISYHYIPRLSLNKTSTVIDWFLVIYPRSNSNVSQLGYNNNCAVVTRMPNTTACDQCMSKLKMAWSSACALVSRIDNCEWGSCAIFVCLFLLQDCLKEILKLLIYNKALNVWSLGKLVSFVFPWVLMFPETN